MPVQYNRREFLKGLLAVSAAGAAASACSPHPEVAPQALNPAHPDTSAAAPSLPAAAPPTILAPSVPPTPRPTAASAEAAYVAVVRGAGAAPAELVHRAVAAIGGIERFVRQGADVIIKPNIGTSYHSFEYAATTNPEVVAAMVALCLGAGARRVRVMDFPFGGSPQACYVNSGTEAAVGAAGGQMEVMNRLRFRQVGFPAGRTVKQWKVYGDILDADLVINVPIAKHHGGARLTLGMKNLMGVIEDRGGFHSRGLHQCIADLSTGVKPQLTVVDAVRILTNNGPTGGSLDDVRRLDTVIASADVVAADAYATTLFGLTGADIPHIRLAAEMGLGQIDLSTVKVEEITI